MAVKEAPDAAFWSALGGEGPIAPASEAPAPEKEEVGEGVLYKLSDSTGSLTCSEAKRGDIKVTDLDSNDVFILDAGREIFVWVGSKASDAERRNAMPTAQAYLHANNKPIHTAVHWPATPLTGRGDLSRHADHPRCRPRITSTRAHRAPREALWRGLEVIVGAAQVHVGKKTVPWAHLNARTAGSAKTSNHAPLAATGTLLHLREPLRATRRI